MSSSLQNGRANYILEKLFLTMPFRKTVEEKRRFAVFDVTGKMHLVLADGVYRECTESGVAIAKSDSVYGCI